jgi:hypothetical protein
MPSSQCATISSDENNNLQDQTDTGEQEDRETDIDEIEDASSHESDHAKMKDRSEYVNKKARREGRRALKFEPITLGRDEGQLKRNRVGKLTRGRKTGVCSREFVHKSGKEISSKVIGTQPITYGLTWILGSASGG